MKNVENWKNVLYIIMHTLNIIKLLKRMSVIEIRDVIFENYYKRIGFSKENTYYSMKRRGKNL